MAAVKQLGHLVLRVGDLEKSVNFYTEILGLSVTTVRPGGNDGFHECSW